MGSINLKLDAPWYTFNKMVKALFDGDPDIEVGDVYDVNDGNFDVAFDIAVKNHQKFIALDRLMPDKKIFGNVTLGIVLYDEENDDGEDLLFTYYKTLFEGNPIVDRFETVKDFAGTDWNYILFKPEVIQFPDDDTSDYYGNWNGIAEDVAREVFGQNAIEVNFCTEKITLPGKKKR